MKIFNQMTNVTKEFPKSAMALGTFDGVHKGHQKIITRAVELAKEISGHSIVVTFSNHPLSIIDPRRCPPQILTYEDRNQFIESLGIDALITIPFTTEFLQVSPEEFIRSLFINISPRYIVVGPNYSFGYQGAGTPQMLENAGRAYGFTTEIMQAVYVDDQIVSSTLIRQMVTQGKVREAAHLLGRSIKISGEVIAGEKRGRTLGYPTANIAIADGLTVPGDGVYAVQVHTTHFSYLGVANVGTNPTFTAVKRRIEVYIFDFAGDLYGQVIGIDFLERIRGEITFNNATQLTQQIAQDILAVQNYYKNNC